MAKFNVLSVFASSFFSNLSFLQHIGDRTIIPLGSFGQISDKLATAWLPSLISAFVTPNFAPPDWFPVLPFEIENAGDIFAWVGTEGVRPTDPRQDPFYHPDISKYADLNNGDIIDIREVGLSKIWLNIKQAFQVSYRSENTLGSPVADVTTIMIPYNPNGKVVSYQMWEDAVSLQCSPSYSLVTGISDPTYDILLLAGFIVNTPDHEGVNSAFAAGIKEGKSTLDSIRAFLNARERIGLDTNANDKIAMWGYSGGTIASGHAAELVPTYAPDLTENIVATVIGGVVANITDLVQGINGGIFTGFGVAGVWGLSTEYPAVKSLLDVSLRKGIRWRFEHVSEVCIFNHLIDYLFQNFWSYTVDDTAESFFYNDDVQEMLVNETLGLMTGTSGVPTMPMLVYNGVQDPICDIYEVDRAVDSWCKSDVPVDYYRYALLEHGGAAVLGIPDICLWIIKMFFHDYKPGSCSSWQDATKRTAPDFDQNKQSLIAEGKWEEAGVLDYLGVQK